MKALLRVFAILLFALPFAVLANPPNHTPRNGDKWLDTGPGFNIMGWYGSMPTKTALTSADPAVLFITDVVNKSWTGTTYTAPYFGWQQNQSIYICDGEDCVLLVFSTPGHFVFMGVVKDNGSGYVNGPQGDPGPVVFDQNGNPGGAMAGAFVTTAWVDYQIIVYDLYTIDAQGFWHLDCYACFPEVVYNYAAIAASFQSMSAAGMVAQQMATEHMQMK